MQNYNQTKTAAAPGLTAPQIKNSLREIDTNYGTDFARYFDDFLYNGGRLRAITPNPRQQNYLREYGPARDQLMSNISDELSRRLGPVEAQKIVNYMSTLGQIDALTQGNTAFLPHFLEKLSESRLISDKSKSQLNNLWVSDYRVLYNREPNFNAVEIGSYPYKMIRQPKLETAPDYSPGSTEGIANVPQPATAREAEIARAEESVKRLPESGGPTDFFNLPPNLAELTPEAQRKQWERIKMLEELTGGRIPYRELREYAGPPFYIPEEPQPSPFPSSGTGSGLVQGLIRGFLEGLKGRRSPSPPPPPPPPPPPAGTTPVGTKAPTFEPGSKAASAYEEMANRIFNNTVNMIKLGEKKNITPLR